MRRVSAIAAGLLVLLSTARCASPPLPPAGVPPMATPTAAAEPAPAADTPGPGSPVPQSAPTAHGPSLSPGSPGPRPVYALDALVDMTAHTAVVSAQVTVRPPAADELVFNMNALQAAGIVHWAEIRVADQLVTPRIDTVWLAVPIGPAAAEPLTVSFAYTLTLPPIEPTAWGWRGTLGWSEHQINLGDWYPTLAIYEAETGWVTPSTSDLGEYQTTPASDFHVQLRLTGPPPAPPILGSGGRTPCGSAHCFELFGGRFVAYVIGRRMELASLVTAAGTPVTAAYLPEHPAAGQAALRAAADALEIFARVYGPYPYPAYSLVEGDFYDGMEYSGLSFVGASYFEDFDGGVQNWLTLIAVHETAHQWWYSLVGNDPAAEPWLDEALATYSELVYLEAAYPDDSAWWWRFRVEYFQPTGAVDQALYAFTGFRPYVDTVYLRGAQMLHAMRQTVGDERFFEALRRYLDARRYALATAADFWQAYQAVGGDPAAIQARFFADP